MTLKEILQRFVNEPYENLVSIAEQALSDLVPVFSRIADDGNYAKFLIPFFATSLAVDGRVTDLEYQFMCDIFGNMPYSTVKALAQDHYNEQMIRFVDSIADICPTELKSTLVTLCCAFLAVDETITREEIAFVDRLLS